MTAQIFQLNDYRPPAAPKWLTGTAELFLALWLNWWSWADALTTAWR